MPLRPLLGPRKTAPLLLLLRRRRPHSSLARIRLPICSYPGRLSSRYSYTALTRLHSSQSPNGCIQPHHISIPSARSYSTEPHWSTRSQNAASNATQPERRLVLLQMPALVRQTIPSESLPIDKTHLDNLTQTLQMFEYQVEDEQVPNEIVLFRPTSLRVSKSRFDQIFKELSTAFLGPQLREYLNSTDIGFPVSKLKKKDAINLVMRQVWKVEVAEEIAAEMDVVKEKELRFTRIDLFFMMAEGGQILQKLATRNRTRIVINPATNIISLSGTKGSIERVEKSLRSIPQRQVQQELDLSPLTRVGVINENHIPGISRLTTTFIDKINDDKLAMCGTIPYGPTNILDAKRLLFNSFDLHFRETYSLLSETQSTESINGALYPISEKQCLPWLYRGADWYRWRGIREQIRWSEDKKDLDEPPSDWLSTPSLISPSESAKLNYDGLRGLLDSPPAESEDPTALEPIPPDAEIYTTYHAVLGQIIHSSPTPPSRIPQSLGSLISQDHRHILCNSVPRLVDFLSTLNPVTYSYDFYILLKFSPSPWANPHNFELLPRAEMEIRVDPETNEVKGLKISAIESSNTTDVLMPKNTLDLRFVRRRLARIESKTGHVRKYIKEADLDVLGEERLRAGEELVLDVPKWLLKGTERQEERSINEESGLTQDQLHPEYKSSLESLKEETVPVAYYFTGLETRSSTTFDYEGAPLVYTKVEAGTSGGSYDEVVLECQKDDIEYMTPQEEQEELQRDEEREHYLGEEEERPLDEENARRHQAYRPTPEPLSFSTRDIPLESELPPEPELEPVILEKPNTNSQTADELFNVDTSNASVESAFEPATIVSSAIKESELQPEEREDFISEKVFQRFVNRARSLIDAVENVEAAKNRRRKL